jgi:hypothetical protein
MGCEAPWRYLHGRRHAPGPTRTARPVQPLPPEAAPEHIQRVAIAGSVAQRGSRSQDQSHREGRDRRISRMERVAIAGSVAWRGSRSQDQSHREGRDRRISRMERVAIAGSASVPRAAGPVGRWFERVRGGYLDLRCEQWHTCTTHRAHTTVRRAHAMAWRARALYDAPQ